MVEMRARWAVQRLQFPPPSAGKGAAAGGTPEGEAADDNEDADADADAEADAMEAASLLATPMRTPSDEGRAHDSTFSDARSDGERTVAKEGEESDDAGEGVLSEGWHARLREQCRGLLDSGYFCMLVAAFLQSATILFVDLCDLPKYVQPGAVDKGGDEGC
eukprot:scaffold218_cov333-Prasinococcus_capsulatus_cf.AAC.16